MKKYLPAIFLLALIGCATGPREPYVYMNPFTREVRDCASEGERAADQGGRNMVTRAYASAAAVVNCRRFSERAGWVPLDR